MGLFERKNLPRSARQIDRVGVSEQDNNIMGEEIDRRNRKSFSA